MKLATWNVNSIRARLDRVIPWLMAEQPDVLCMQELKVEEKEFPADAFAAAGYQVARSCQPTYNGVGIASKLPIEDVACGLDDGEDDAQRRLIAATIGGVRVLSAYFPNGQSVGSDKYEFKMRWMERLRTHLDRSYKAAQPVVLCGDFNVAPEPRDVYDPAYWERTTLYHPSAREALRKIAGFGLVDAFRLKNDEPGVYSWWDYRMLMFAKGKGLRIDHVFVSSALAPHVAAARIDRDARKGKNPSDHAPVIVELDLANLAAEPLPQIAPRLDPPAPASAPPELKSGQGSLF